MRQGIAFLLALSLLIAPTTASAGSKKKRNADAENIGRRDINKGSWNLYSPEREVALGAALAREAERSARLLDDLLVTAYVSEVAEGIGRNSDLRVPLRVRVIDSEELDAFALPGGHFFITTGVVLQSESEAELAAVIGHEVAHVAARHATKQRTRVQLWNWMSIPLLFVGGPAAYGVQQGLALAVPLSFLQFSRNAEREADFLGQQYHYASGYDPVAFVDFFERVKKRTRCERGGIAKAFSTHPMTRDRTVAAQRTVEEVLPPREEYVVTTSRFDEVRAYLEALQGERRRRDASNGPVLRKRNADEDPSASLKTASPF